MQYAQFDAFGSAKPVAAVASRPMMPPLANPERFPGASPRLDPILAAIASLGREDQAALLLAFKSAITPSKPLRISGGNTYRGYDDFMPALRAAREAVTARYGRRWWLNRDACIPCRVPAAWVSCKIFGGVSRSPRDLNLPRGEFWPMGVLPVGPEYSEHPPLYTESPQWQMEAAERADERAKTAAILNEVMNFDFALEPTPDGEIEMSAADELETV